MVSFRILYFHDNDRNKKMNLHAAWQVHVYLEVQTVERQVWQACQG